MQPKFKLIDDTEDMMRWISQEIIYGNPEGERGVDCEGPFYYFMELEYLDRLMDNPTEKYCVSIMVVAPLMVNEKAFAETCESLGMDFQAALRLEDAIKAVVLHDGHIGATLFAQNGNNKEDLLRAARRKVNEIDMMFGMYMDRPQNMLGSTGWDFVRGNILAGLNKERV